MTEKVFIKNRKGQNVAVLCEGIENPKGLAFVMHGLGGFKEQPHIRVYAEAFLARGYAAVRFDATNSIGESDGKFEDATVTNYYEDLEDVIAWARSRPWFREPFCLVGHSLGGICTALYAEKYPNHVKALAPTSTVVSGKLSVETQSYQSSVREWEQTGWLVRQSISKPGVEKRLKWSHMVDRLKYDLLPNVSKLTMPVLLIVGEHDDLTPPEHQRILFEELPGRKEIHIIQGAEHTFREKAHLKEIRSIFDRWIENL